MKTQSILLLCLVALLVSPPASAGDEEKLKESLKKWQQLRDKNHGNYSYAVRWSSFAGFGHETEIFVRDNKVAQRRFRAFSGRPRPVRPGDPAPKPEGKSWVEEGTEIGKHKQGAAPKTIDELYVEAAAVLARELPKHERRYVRFDKQGLLLSCFTVDTRIADDAPTKGVRISRIALGKGSKPMGAAAEKKVYKAPNGKAFPAHWGAPPRIQTRDLRPLPGGYGRGSSTLARWIQENLDRDKAKKE